MDHRAIRHIAVAIAACAVLAHVPLAAQTALPPPRVPEFEVASIHQNLNPDPAWSMGFTKDGLLAKDVTLLWALHDAYGIYDDDRWSGGPAWLDKARFDIEAKFDATKYPSLTREERQIMLRQLLADRFKLSVHHEPKVFPLYELVLAKTGPKFKETESREIRRSPISGDVICEGGGRRGKIDMHGCTIKQLADNLSGYAHFDLGRKVVDQTGLTGHYTFALQWARVDATNPSNSALNAPEPDGPSIFTALLEQLGLELKTIKGPLDTMVIDHAEMPSEN
jgi:uncharacterized protein (TIGR03435 family)